MKPQCEYAANFIHYNLRPKDFINADKSRDRGTGVFKGVKDNENIMINYNLMVNCREERRGKWKFTLSLLLKIRGLDMS